MFDYNALQKAAADDDDKKKDAPAAEPEEAAPTPEPTPELTPEPTVAAPAPAAVAAPAPAPTPATPGATVPVTPSAVPLPSPPPGAIDAAGRGLARVRAAATRGKQTVAKGKQTVAKGQRAVDKTKEVGARGQALAAKHKTKGQALRDAAQQRSLQPITTAVRDNTATREAGKRQAEAAARAKALAGVDPALQPFVSKAQEMNQSDSPFKQTLGRGAFRAATSDHPAAQKAREALNYLTLADNPVAGLNRAALAGAEDQIFGGGPSLGSSAYNAALKAAPWLGGGYLAHRFALRPAARFLGGAVGAARNPAGSAAATAGANRATYKQLVKQFRASGMSNAAAKQQASTVLASMQAQAMNTAQTAQGMAAKGQTFTGQPAAAKPAAGGGFSKLLQSASRRLAGLPGWGKALAGAGALGAGMYGGNKLLSSSYGGGSVKQANPLLSRALPLLQRAKTGLGGWWKGLSPTAKTVGVGLAAAPTLSYMLGAGQQPQQAPQGMYDPTMQGTMTALPFQSMQRMPSLFERQMQMARYASADEPMTKKATVELEMADGSMHTFRA